MTKSDQLADAVAALIRYEIAKATQYHAADDFQLPSASELETALIRGKGRAIFFGSVLVKIWMVPSIVADPDNSDFFRAVVREEDGAYDMDPEHLYALRRYVLAGDLGMLLRAFGDSLCLRLVGAIHAHGAAPTPA
ncbi:MAG TPA: hypothetical protein VFC56_11305 [Stellaceae bacterium]|nr:hypothetical protein [Stellaceae bacterium]